jgi:hypothetical protein
MAAHFKNHFLDVVHDRAARPPDSSAAGFTATGRIGRFWLLHGENIVRLAQIAEENHDGSSEEFDCRWWKRPRRH